MPDLDSDILSAVPERYQGLWHRTLLERHGDGTLTNARPAQVYWLQTRVWHCDIRIPDERTELEHVSSLDECSDEQLQFIAGQEGFFGLTRVDGSICTWLRLHDLNPGVALDAGRMEFQRDDLIFEHGIAERYLEHWSLVDGSKPDGRSCPLIGSIKHLLLVSGDHAARIALRGPAPADFDAYRPIEAHSREHLLWRSSLELSLCRRSAEGWLIRLSTLPWLEGSVFDEAGYVPVAGSGLMFGAA